MTVVSDARTVLMSTELALMLGVTFRPLGDSKTCLVDRTEAELLAFGAARVEWGAPDAHGWYTPTLYSKTTESLP